MATLKTQPTSQDVTAFLEKIENPKKRADSQAILEELIRRSAERKASTNL